MVVRRESLCHVPDIFLEIRMRQRVGLSDLKMRFLRANSRAFGEDAFNPGWWTGRPGWA